MCKWYFASRSYRLLGCICALSSTLKGRRGDSLLRPSSRRSSFRGRNIEKVTPAGRPRRDDGVGGASSPTLKTHGKVMRSTLLSRVLLLHAGASAFRLGTSPALLSRSGLFSATNVVAPAVLLAAKPARAASSVTMSGGDELVAQIQSTVSSSKVVVYSKSYCPFCAKTKVRPATFRALPDRKLHLALPLHNVVVLPLHACPLACRWRRRCSTRSASLTRASSLMSSRRAQRSRMRCLASRSSALFRTFSSAGSTSAATTTLRRRPSLASCKSCSERKSRAPTDTLE